MPTPPSLTETDIHDVVDGGPWQRGRSYFSSGRLIHPRQQDGHAQG